jgi:hypothetical protein
MKTDSELRQAGIQALSSTLGDIDAERFVSLLSKERFDYTRWQVDLWADKSVREISSKAMEYRKHI